jgi:hypothetical protein
MQRSTNSAQAKNHHEHVFYESWEYLHDTKSLVDTQGEPKMLIKKIQEGRQEAK